jgi:hypothetical protein
MSRLATEFSRQVPVFTRFDFSVSADTPLLPPQAVGCQGTSLDIEVRLILVAFSVAMSYSISNETS